MTMILALNHVAVFVVAYPFADLILPLNGVWLVDILADSHFAVCVGIQPVPCIAGWIIDLLAASSKTLTDIALIPVIAEETAVVACLEAFFIVPAGRSKCRCVGGAGGIGVFDGNDSTVPTFLCAAVCRVCNDLELVLLQPSGKGIQSSGSSGGGNTDVDPCFSVRVFRWVIFKLVRIHVIGAIVLC